MEINLSIKWLPCVGYNKTDSLDAVLVNNSSTTAVTQNNTMDFTKFPDYEPWMDVSDPTEEDIADPSTWFGWHYDYLQDFQNGSEIREKAQEKAEPIYQRFLNGEPIDDDDLLVLKATGYL